MSKPPKKKFPKAVDEKFVDTFRKHPCLWNKNSSDFKSKEAKSKAFKALQSVLAKEDADVTENTTKRKLSDLKWKYQVERDKVKKSISQGETEYVPQWYLYEKLSFIPDKSPSSSLLQQPDKQHLQITSSENNNDEESVHSPASSCSDFCEIIDNSPQVEVQSKEAAATPALPTVKTEKVSEPVQSLSSGSGSVVLHQHSQKDSQPISKIKSEKVSEPEQLVPSGSGSMVLCQHSQKVSVPVSKIKSENAIDQDKPTSTSGSIKEKRRVKQGLKFPFQINKKRKFSDFGDEVRILTDTLESTWKKISPEQRIYAKKLINDILCYAELGKLSEKCDRLFLDSVHEKS